MKTTTITLTEKRAALVRDALRDSAVNLRTNHMNGVVIPEATFLSNPEVSPKRKEHYNELAALADYLEEFVRLA